MIDLSKEKLELDYPCNWIYKVVVHDTHKIEVSMDEIFEQREYSVNVSKKSSKGNYTSYTLELLVEDEEDRVSIYETLKKHKDIKMVI